MAVCLGFGGSNIGQILDHFLRVLRLPGSGLSSTENTLVLAILKQTNQQQLMNNCPKLEFYEVKNILVKLDIYLIIFCFTQKRTDIKSRNSLGSVKSKNVYALE